MRLVVALVLVWVTQLASGQMTEDERPGLELPKPPNVVLIFCDDLGYADLGCFGARDWETPNLDSMAEGGIKLTDFYVPQPVCSASRAGLLTGCYPNRVGIEGALFPRDSVGLAPEETTMAEVFQAAGYNTACFGKWHLGFAPEFLPTRHGFGEFFGIPYSNDMWPHGPVSKNPRFGELPVFEGEEVVRTLLNQSHLTKMLTKRAVGFIEKNRNQPFFLYLAHPQPHVPLFASEEFRGSSEGGLYGDVIQELDWSTGEILRALREVNVAEDTLIIFTSDNGPWKVFGDHGGRTGLLKGHKGTNWEGGVRVPCVMQWPGVLPEARTISTPLMTIDLLPTFLELLNKMVPEEAKPQQKIDGVSAWSVLSGATTNPVQEAYYFYYGNNELQAVRSGPWKLVFPHKHRWELKAPGTGGKAGVYSSVETAGGLFHLPDDPGEARDRAATEPEVLARLQQLAAQKRVELGDRLQLVEGSERRAAGTAVPFDVPQ